MNRRACQLLVIVANAQVQCELGSGAKIVLHEKGIFGKIRLRRAAGCPDAWEVLRVSSWSIGIQRCVGWKRVSTTKHAGKEIENAIKVEVQTRLPIAAATQIRNVVNKLHSFDGRLAGAKIIPPNTDAGARPGTNDSFRLVAVGLARFLVSRPLKAKFIDECLRQRRGESAGQSVAFYQAVSRMFLGAQRSIILVVDSGKALMVVTQSQLVGVI